MVRSMFINRNAGLWMWMFFLLNIVLVTVDYSAFVVGMMSDTKGNLVSGVVFLALTFVSTKVFTSIVMGFICFAYIMIGVCNILVFVMQ